VIKPIFVASTICAVLFAACFAAAGPSLDIRSGPVVNSGWTGPSNDPAAAHGQWFLDPGTGAAEFLTHEFYDNPVGYGGGSQGHYAITGIVTHLDLCG
jgi:hypothetical protein